MSLTQTIRRLEKLRRAAGRTFDPKGGIKAPRVKVRGASKAVKAVKGSKIAGGAAKALGGAAAVGGAAALGAAAIIRAKKAFDKDLKAQIKSQNRLRELQKRLIKLKRLEKKKKRSKKK